MTLLISLIAGAIIAFGGTVYFSRQFLRYLEEQERLDIQREMDEHRGPR